MSKRAFPPEPSGEPPSPPLLEEHEERQLDKVRLRDDLPQHKAVLVSLVEEGWPYWMRTVLRGLRAGAKPGARQNRTAMNSFQKALVECGRLADAVAALLRRLGVSSEEELEQIVTAYRQASQATAEDTVEASVRRLEAHFKTGKGRAEHEQIGRRLGFNVKGGKDA